MTERSVPIVGGASVCPFVAFEDDRDERGSRPDHRHRCFAEVRPATRALAHQEAYCLAPAFPACPTFQDWARREAARARASQASVRAPETTDEPVVRAPRREWSAPPPWLDESGGASRSTAADAAGLAGSAGADASSPAAGVRPTSGAGRPAPGAGLAESAGLAAVGAADTGVDDDRPDDEGDEDDHYRAVAPSYRSSGSSAPSERRPSVSESRRRTRSLGGPSWERPQHHEAYPTIRTRVGLPGIPRAAVAFAGLVAAALLLFFIPPMLIRPGGGADTGGGPTPTPSTEPAASFAPTPIPAPTPEVYVIVAGDTLSKVAQRNGLTLEELLAVNPSIKNPDRISIGDEIILPAPVPSEVVDLGGTDTSPEPSVVP